MAYHPDDTIVAIASASGVGARGILRLSGSAVIDVLGRCFHSLSPPGEDGGPRSVDGHLALADSQRLPAVLYVWPNARTYTRQTSAEIHTVACPALLEAALTQLCACGARLAEPGEFTLRAFLGGRFDLTQAEAVLGVIDARSGSDLETALAQLAGGIARPLAHLRGTLLDVLAHLEAGLDFVEEDIEFITAQQIQAALEGAQQQVRVLVEQMRARSDVAHRVPVALVGRPNVGKSSLFNAIASGEALVSPLAGTTRDYLTARLDLDGVHCELVDTAGLDANLDQDRLQGAAQELATEQHRHANLRLLCLDATCEPNLQEQSTIAQSAPEQMIVVWTKCDLAKAQPPSVHAPDMVAVETSARTRAGIGQLRGVIRERLLNANHSETGVVATTAARCSTSLRRALRALERASKLNREGRGEEVLAADLRTALDELGAVAGAVYTDDILDRVFSRFCIGK